MKFEHLLIEGTLVKRYKRFLADVELTCGKQITVYCPNTGSMKGCAIPGSKVWLSHWPDSNRKYPHTWELIQIDDCMIGINTARSNALVADAIKNSKVSVLDGYDSFATEVKYGKENSRIDILLSYGLKQCYVEVKNVTLVEDDGIAYFPDAVTTRGQKHLRELMHMINLGQRGVIFYCVQHTSAKLVKPAFHIDPQYGQLLREAHSKGVEIIAYQADISPDHIELMREIPVVLD